MGRLRQDGLRRLAVAVYLPLLAVWIYLGHYNDVAALVLLCMVGLMTFLEGAAIGRWWAALLPLAAVPIAIPAPADWDPEFAVWFDVALFFVPPAVAVALIGIGMRKLAARR